MRATRWLAGAVVGVTGLALSACGQQNSSEGFGGSQQDELRVVATTSILGDITRNVVGDAGQVEVLIEPGTDPHAFEPSGQQVVALRKADLVVATGLEFVPALVDGLQAAERGGANVVRVAEQVGPIAYVGSAGQHGRHGEEGHADAAHGHETEHGHADGEHGKQHSGQEHGALDPHVWLDPVRMADGARLTAERVAAVAPQQAQTVRANAANYADKVMATHHQVEDILASVPADRRKLVTNHDALGYFAQRYDFEVVGTVIPGGSTLSDSSGGGIAELVSTVERERVSAIFAETTASTRLAEAVSREVGSDVEVVELYTGSLATDGKASTYVGMLTVNAQRIAAGLSG